MSNTADISPAIVETLYEEALDLADAARAAFDQRRLGDHAEEARIALSSETLRTTTRMMHALAWLLNQRAFFRGELSEFALRRHGRLPPPQPETRPDQLRLLDHDLQVLVARTSAFYARIGRLDEAWRKHFAMEPTAVERLRMRIGERMGA